MTLHDTTFGYLKPSDEQIDEMQNVRAAFAVFVAHIEKTLPDGADKTYIIRQLRDCAMWANVALTRQADGTPRG
jgi:hypothetical protein